MIDWIALFISTSFFTGILSGKIMGRPGAGGGLFGSLVGLIFLLTVSFFSGKGDYNTVVWMIIISFALGMLVIGRAERFMNKKWGAGPRHTGEIVEHDFNQTNIDEFHGQLIAGLPVFIFPCSTFCRQTMILIASFFLFRFFDIEKPWPIGYIEKNFKGSFGIMFDDTLAGIMAGIYVSVILWTSRAIF